MTAVHGTQRALSTLKETQLYAVLRFYFPNMQTHTLFIQPFRPFIDIVDVRYMHQNVKKRFNIQNQQENTNDQGTKKSLF